MKDIKILFRAYAELTNKNDKHEELSKLTGEDKRSDELTSWQQFMAILLHVKKQKMKPSIFEEPPEGLLFYFSRRILAKLKGNDMEKKKFGDWYMIKSFKIIYNMYF